MLSQYLSEIIDVEAVSYDNWQIGKIREQGKVLVHFIGNPQKENLSFLNWNLTLGLELSRVSSEIMNRKNFDIIHANDWQTIYLAVSLKKAFGTKLFLTMHSTEKERNPYSNTEFSKSVSQIEWNGCYFADKIFVNNERTLNSLLHDYRVPAEKIVISNTRKYESVIEEYKKVIE